MYNEEECTRIKSEYNKAFKDWLENVLLNPAVDKTRISHVLPEEYVTCVKLELEKNKVDKKLERMKPSS